MSVFGLAVVLGQQGL